MDKHFFSFEKANFSEAFIPVYSSKNLYTNKDFIFLNIEKNLRRLRKKEKMPQSHRSPELKSSIYEPTQVNYSPPKKAKVNYYENLPAIRKSTVIQGSIKQIQIPLIKAINYDKSKDLSSSAEIVTIDGNVDLRALAKPLGEGKVDSRRLAYRQKSGIYYFLALKKKKKTDLFDEIKKVNRKTEKLAVVLEQKQSLKDKIYNGKMQIIDDERALNKALLKERIKLQCESYRCLIEEINGYNVSTKI